MILLLDYQFIQNIDSCQLNMDLKPFFSSLRASLNLIQPPKTKTHSSWSRFLSHFYVTQFIAPETMALS